MTWHIKTFEELTKEELYTILRDRVNIFIVEQQCPYPEIDDVDQDSFHLFFREEKDIQAYCRIIPKGLKYEDVSIGRVIVNKEFRRKGLASSLMKKAIRFVYEELKEPSIKIQAQDHLRQFYGSFGFLPISETYLEDGIPHVDMKLSSMEYLQNSK